MSGKTAIITIIAVCLLAAVLFGAFKKDRVVDFEAAFATKTVHTH